MISNMSRRTWARPDLSYHRRLSESSGQCLAVYLSAIFLVWTRPKFRQILAAVEGCR